jgi:hypothetical protein
MKESFERYAEKSFSSKTVVTVNTHQKSAGFEEHTLDEQGLRRVLTSRKDDALQQILLAIRVVIV